jgi:hypothetical protein
LPDATGGEATYVETNGVPDAETLTVKTTCPGAAPNAHPGSGPAATTPVQHATIMATVTGTAVRLNRAAIITTPS